MKAALHQLKEPIDLPVQSTLADGIAVRRAGMRTLPLVREYVDQIVTVDEDEIAAAILVLLESEKTVAEGAGAIALSAVLQAKTEHRGKNIAVLVSGGNLDVNLLARIIEQGLVRDGRRLRLRVRLPDYPGALEGLASVIAKGYAPISWRPRITALTMVSASTKLRSISPWKLVDAIMHRIYWLHLRALAMNSASSNKRHVALRGKPCNKGAQR